MTKRFCDYCNQEITDKNRLTVSVPLKQGVYMQINSGANDACKYCIFDAVRQLDDRDQVRAA